MPGSVPRTGPALRSRPSRTSQLESVPTGYETIAGGREDHRLTEETVNFKEDLTRRYGEPVMKVFTTGQVAKICKVAPRTVSKWFDSGRLKGYRIPGSQDRRIPRDYLIKFLKEHGMPWETWKMKRWRRS